MILSTGVGQGLARVFPIFFYLLSYPKGQFIDLRPRDLLPRYLAPAILFFSFFSFSLHTHNVYFEVYILLLCTAPDAENYCTGVHLHLPKLLISGGPSRLFLPFVSSPYTASTSLYIPLLRALSTTELLWS